MIEFPASVIEDIPNLVEWLVPATFLQAEYEWTSVRLIVTPSRVMIYDLKGMQQVFAFVVVFVRVQIDSLTLGCIAALDRPVLKSSSSGCDARQCTERPVSDWKRGNNLRFSKYVAGGETTASP